MMYWTERMIRVDTRQYFYGPTSFGPTVPGDSSYYAYMMAIKGVVKRIQYYPGGGNAEQEQEFHGEWTIEQAKSIVEMLVAAEGG